MSVERNTPARLRPVTPIGILAARLQTACTRLDEVAGASEPAAELHSARALAAGLEPYVAYCTTPESPALAALAQRTNEHDWTRRSDGAVAFVEPEMLSGHVEGQTLKF